jgi:hypothetical protein
MRVVMSDTERVRWDECWYKKLYTRLCLESEYREREFVWRGRSC